MAPERWVEIERLYHSALDRSPDRRSAFLKEACGGDESLRREVESLLQQSAEGVLDKPPWQALGDGGVDLGASHTAVSAGALIGQTISHYRVVEKLGAGGMGVVYRAEDIRLHRFVALKVLPDDFARDPARSRRFEQEARVVAALNHPNIVAVYDVGQNYLVSELVDGQTLRHAGKLSQRQAIDFAVQVAEGLAAAHAAGITHRDLKPENIMVTRDGRAKILDFGLAKMTRSLAADTPASQVPTQTQEGMIMGTVGYMSPEQVQGQPADHRSDIFSFGLVLYEMLAHRRAFSGGSTLEVMSAILKLDPHELPESVGLGLKRVVEHCLDKNPDRRFQSASDLAFALQAPPASGPQGAPVPVSRTRRFGLFIAAGAFAIAAVAIGASYFLWHTPAPPAWTGVMLGGPEMALNPRPSPDGHLLAILAMVDGLTQVAVMKPETGNWTLLTRDRTRGQVSVLSWSPDGALIYYSRSNGATKGIYSVPVLGGDEHLVAENTGGVEALPDGSLIIGKPDAVIQPRRSLSRFWPGTGRLQEIPFVVGFSPSQNTGVRANPDGKSALIWGQPPGQPAAAMGVYAVDLASGAAKRLTPPDSRASDVAAFAVAPDGKSIFVAVNSGALTRIISLPANGSAAERTLFTVTSTVWYLDAGADGSVYVSMLDRPSDLVQFSVDGTRFERIASFPLVPEDPDIVSILPDGRAVLAIRASGQNRLMVVQKGKDPAPLVNTTEETMTPAAACGSGEVAFMIGPAPNETIAFTEPATGRVVRKVAPGKGRVDSISCSPDGKTLYFSAGGVIWSIPSSGGEAQKVREGQSVVADPAGGRLVVKMIESSQTRLFSVPLDGGPEHEIQLDQSIRVGSSRLSTDSLSADGRLLAPLAPRDSWFNPPGIIDTATGRITRIPSDNQGDYRSLAWTRDGQVIALKNGLRATIWKFQLAAH
jgi:predicted Ser/Thr protein kinase/Tol biopolymer transport system component